MRPSPEEIKAAPQPASQLPPLEAKQPAPQPAPAPQREAAQETPGPQNGPLPPGWSVEQVAQNKALAAQLAEIKDPEQRAEAQRLLSEIKQEAAARQPRRQREQALELEP